MAVLHPLQGKLFIAGHRGMVGSALVRAAGQCAGVELVTRTRQELDLMDRAAVRRFFEKEKPDLVIDAAATVGGIKANSDAPVDFLLNNLTIQNNLISSAHESGVARLLFLGSSCIYPKLAPQPIEEESLLTGPLEPTNEWYAIAKIAGLKLCQAYRRQFGSSFISTMPTNLYGPNDNFDLETSHVLPALIRKFHDAKESNQDRVVLWGTGSPRREFLHVDDAARACLHLLETYDGEAPLNLGCGEDVTIRELAEIVAGIVGFAGEVEWDTRMPDGTPRKLLDVSKIRSLGWQPRISLEDGIRGTYAWFLENGR
jgi:GDP-L-fucose synthase